MLQALTPFLPSAAKATWAGIRLRAPPISGTLHPRHSRHGFPVDGGHVAGVVLLDHSHARPSAHVLDDVPVDSCPLADRAE